MKTKLLFSAIAMLLSVTLFGQEEVWESQKHITGYISTEIDYFNNLDDRYFERNYGINVAEAGILFNYKPLRKLNIKSVMVYRPTLELNQMINELSAEWAFDDAIKVTAGRMLTPLSPVNTYFYAPVNLGVTLPILISQHAMYPINFEGLSLNGKVGGDFNADYNVFGGSFNNSLWLPSGAVGFFGRENDYFAALDWNLPSLSNTAAEANSEVSYGGGGHLAANWKDILHVGINYFHGDESAGEDSTAIEVTKNSYGLEFEIKYATVKISGEYWRTDIDFLMPYYNNFEFTMDNNTSAYYQISNQFGKFTPYITFETNDMLDTKYNRLIGGVNYKPIFETTLKLEYFAYNKHDVNGLLFSIIYSF